MPFMSVAQDSEGKINGSVKDPDGAVVAGASVSLLHSHRAVIAATVTDAEGSAIVTSSKDSLVLGRKGFHLILTGL